MDSSQISLFSVKYTRCDVCPQIAPLFDDLAQRYNNARLQFIKVDVDDMKELASRAGVVALPTFIIYRDGVIVEGFSGVNRELLEQWARTYSASY